MTTDCIPLDSDELDGIPFDPDGSDGIESPTYSHPALRQRRVVP